MAAVAQMYTTSPVGDLSRNLRCQDAALTSLHVSKSRPTFLIREQMHVLMRTHTHTHARTHTHCPIFICMPYLGCETHRHPQSHTSNQNMTCMPCSLCRHNAPYCTFISFHALGEVFSHKQNTFMHELALSGADRMKQCVVHTWP